MTDTEKELLQKLLDNINTGLDNLKNEIEELDTDDEDRQEWDSGYIAGIASVATTIRLILKGEIPIEHP